MSQSFEDKLESFISGLDKAQLVRRTSEIAQIAEYECQVMLDNYLGEAFVGLDLIRDHLDPDLRFLEIGCGAGLLTSFLTSEGFDIIGIEPGAAGGFSFMPALIAALEEQLEQGQKPKILPIGAEDLTQEQTGKFDVIFSVNVVEHIMVLPEAFAAMTRVLGPNGKMIHLCANYAFPYEPHLGIPLVPFAPQLTRYVFPRVISNHRGIWANLNFVTASKVRRLGNQNGLVTSFAPNVMASFFDRLSRDKVFASRHQGLIGALASSSMTSSIISALLKLMPPMAATPMTMIMRHDA